MESSNKLPFKAKLPPHSIEAEQALLGALMLDVEGWDKASDHVSLNDFYLKAHQLVFQAIAQLVTEQLPIDLITVSKQLEQNGWLEDIGGLAYLAELARNTPSVSNIRAYASTVRESAAIRELINATNDIADACYEPAGRNNRELLELAESKIFRIAESRTKKTEGPQPLKPLLEEAVTRIEALSTQEHNGITGIATGYVDFDKKTAGLQRSDLIILAARPGMGKTTLAVNFCEHAALTQEYPVLIFSLEMPSVQLLTRMFSSLSRIEHDKIKRGNLDNSEWARLGDTIKTLRQKGKLFIDDGSGLSPTELRARARRVYKDHGGLSMIMVDYLQLMQVPELKDNRTLEIGEISRSLKALAKELNVPVVVLSQLNRSVEQRADKRPMNSDLRESGSIEQDADIILFIYRDDYYNEDSQDKNVAEVIISKHRNGETGTVRLAFAGRYSRFDNLAINSNTDDDF